MHAGNHKRMYAGAGDEFFQYRPYEQGESVSRIDWRASAKQDKPLVRQWRQMQGQLVYFYLQNSPLLETAGKKEYAEQIAYALSALMLEGQEEIVLHQSQQSFKQHIAPLYMAQQNLDVSDVPYIKPLRRGSHFILVGDFLSLGQAGLQNILSLVQNVQLYIVQVSAKEEVLYPFKGATEFKSLNDAQNMEALKSEDLRETYLKKRAALKLAYQSLCQKHAGAFMEVLSSDSIEQSLQKIYLKLS